LLVTLRYLAIVAIPRVWDESGCICWALVLLIYVLCLYSGRYHYSRSGLYL